ncbi:unnamed protein product [Linum trigynum]|uniref:Uncharacterized protein n=1 Tax=Linum trigynum TaxID=586398 RepID=A0AAV2FJT4_9ROSI
MAARELEDLTENRSDASFLRRKRGREVRDYQERGSSICEPWVACEVRQPVDGGDGSVRGGWDDVRSEKTERKMINGVHQ